MQKPKEPKVYLPSAENVFSPFVRPLAALAIFIGLCVLSGWTIHPVLSSFLSRGMRANTSLACLLCGISLWLVQNPEPSRVQRFVRKGCAAIAALIGLLSLSEYATGIDLGIDELIARDMSGLTKYPGRIYANTAFNLSLFGISLWLTSSRSTRAHQLAQVLALITLFVSLCAVTAQIYGAKVFPLVGPHANSITALVVFHALGFGILFSRADKGLMSVLASRTLAGTIGRRLLFGSVVWMTGLGMAARAGQKAGVYDAAYRDALSAMGYILIISGFVWYGTRRGAIAEQKRIHIAKERTRLLIEQENAISIRRSEATLRAILDSALDAVIGIDVSGRITDWNPKAESIFGWRKSEVLGRPIVETIIPPKNRGRNPSAMQEYFATNPRRTPLQATELEAMRSTGEVFPVEMSISAIQTDDSCLFTAFVSDITERKKSEIERKRAEADLRKAKDAAEAGNQAKSDFIANMSHELRTPLNGIIGMSDLMIDTSLDPQQRKYCKAILESGNALLTIVNDILDFSKIEAGRLDLEMIDFDLLSLVEGQADLLASRAQAKGLSIMTFVDPKIPQTVEGDPGRIGQILLNLLSNAIKFTEKGSIVLRAVAEATDVEPTPILFSVQDTGIGIVESTQNRLFQRFTQGDQTTARRYGGTGLGLSICKRLVEMMGGTIGVDSERGKGSTFWFRLSLARSRNTAQVTEQSVEGLKDLRILVVDDDPTASEIVGAYLERWRMNSSVAGSGEEALRLMREQAAAGKPFDLAIVDRMMAGMDGYALAREIGSDARLAKTRLTLLTAFDRARDAAAEMGAGFSACLTKPVRQSDLYNAIVATAVNLAPCNSRNGSPEKAEVVPAPVMTPRRILVAEDNSVNQLLAITLLKKLGHSAQGVANGREVIEALGRAAYDLVLMDCQMPEMDGFEATRAIRKREEETGVRIPIVALTANVLNADQVKCWECGMDDHIGKPLKKEKLVEAIERWCPDDEQRRDKAPEAIRPPEASAGKSVFQLRKMIDDLAVPLRAGATMKGIDLNVRVAKDIPNKLAGDGALIARMVASLIDSAVGWTAGGKVNLEATKEGESLSKVRLRFRVADSGGGLSEEAIGKVLGDFSKQRMPPGGTGVEGCSTMGEGSAFWFEAELEKAASLAVASAPQNGAQVRGAEGHDPGIPQSNTEESEIAYDRKHLLDSVDGNAELAREIVTMYLAESPRMVSDLGKSVERLDREGIESTAHRLRGAMLAMGARAAVIAADLEELAQSGQLVACPERFAILAARARALDEALVKQELGGVSPPKQ